jgi:hypothetical protein
MAFYQVKTKGKEERNYSIIRASSIEEAIKEALRSEESLKEAMKERYKLVEIEDVKLFWDKDGPVTMIEEETPEVFLEIKHLGEIGFLHASDHFDWQELRTLLAMIESKIERAYSLLDAYYDFTENDKSLLEEK